LPGVLVCPTNPQEITMLTTPEDVINSICERIHYDPVDPLWSADAAYDIVIRADEVQAIYKALGIYVSTKEALTDAKAANSTYANHFDGRSPAELVAFWAHQSAAEADADAKAMRKAHADAYGTD
jgi:hypothetical protein